MHRIRRKKIMPGEQANDDLIQDPLNKFKIDTYIGGLYITLNYINKYLNNKSIGIYKDLALFSKK